MAQVLGIGGIFFKTDNLEATRDWYERVLGFSLEDWGGAVFPASARAYQVWTPFERDTDYFEPSSAPYMLNLMVDDLEAVLARAESEGVEAIGRQDDDTFGKFAWLIDPNGIKLELWQPAVSSS